MAMVSIQGRQDEAGRGGRSSRWPVDYVGDVPLRGRDVLLIAESVECDASPLRSLTSSSPHVPMSLSPRVIARQDASREPANGPEASSDPERMEPRDHVAARRPHRLCSWPVPRLCSDGSSATPRRPSPTGSATSTGLKRIERGDWTDGVLKGIDHPLHPLGIVAAHRVLGGVGPASWQRAALSLCFLCAVLLVVPTYLLALELFGPQAAWLACVLVLLNPIIGYIVVNILSESTFLSGGHSACGRRSGSCERGDSLWLPLAIGFGALAYLTRPEGMLLPAAVVLTLLLLPMLRATRINWPRWWRAAGLPGGGAGPAGRSIHRDQGGAGNQAGHRPGAGTRAAVGPHGAGTRASAVRRPVDAGDLPRRHDPDAQGLPSGGDPAPVRDGRCWGWPWRASRGRESGPGSSWRSCWPRRLSGWCGCMPREGIARSGMDWCPA